MLLTHDFKDQRLTAIATEPVKTYSITAYDLISFHYCPVCAGGPTKPICHVYVNELEIYRTVACHCGHVWRNIRPSPEWTQNCSKTIEHEPINLKVEDMRCLAYIKREDFISRHVVDKTVLDIGAAFGTGLDVFADCGYDAAAVEYDPRRADFLRKEMRIPTYQGTIEQMLAKYPESGRQYGVVLLCHVLEHTIKPYELMLQLHKLVNRTGFLYVEVPTWDIINWSDAFYLAHQSNFTATSLIRLAHLTGWWIKDGWFVIHEDNRRDIGLLLAPQQIDEWLIEESKQDINLLYRRGLPVADGPLKYQVPYLDHFNYGIRFNHWNAVRNGEFIDLVTDNVAQEAV